MDEFPVVHRRNNAHSDTILRDLAEPFSVVNLVPQQISELILALPEALVDVTETQLEKLIPNPLPSTNQLRRLFWIEYDRAVDNRQKMDMSRVYTGVMTRNAFIKALHSQEVLAWVLNPPVEYTTNVEELLTLGLKQIREILNLPLVNPANGFVDSKLADTKLRTVMMLDMRLKGGFVHRSMQITHNLNQNENKTTIQVDSTGNMDLNEKIKYIEEEIKRHEAIVQAAKNPSLPKPEDIIELKTKKVVEAPVGNITQEEG